MIDYISGTIKTLNPTFVIIENSGIGHIMEISLQTYAELEGKEKLFELRYTIRTHCWSLFRVVY